LAYTPTPTEARRLGRAIELAKFTEGERIFWLTSFLALVALDVVLVTRGGSWAGLLGSLGGFAVLYWRLRGGHLARHARGDHGLFGPNLSTREQRAFTALMFRYVLTGQNMLAQRPEHNPFARWGQQGERTAAPEEA
jgi:hypothetical protein